MIFLHAAILCVSFIVLFKCANLLVTGACGISDVLKIPKIVVGIVFVGLATTVPEFGVSVFSSALGHPEYALGNAMGSVIADDTLAMGLAGIVAPAVIFISCRTLKIAGAFLLGIDFIAYFLACNGTVGRAEGVFFLGLLLLYFYIFYRTGLFQSDEFSEDEAACDTGGVTVSKWRRLRKPALLFAAGIFGVLLASRYGVVHSALYITDYFKVPEIIVGATVIAIGTSLPEISTCIAASLKGEGELAVGDIIGADVLNILWIIGVSSIVRPIQVDVDIINFQFPFMILVVTVMLSSLLVGCRLNRKKAIVLVFLYGLYLFLTFVGPARLFLAGLFS